VLDAYTRAEALCDHLGERVDLFPAIWGQWMFRTGRSEMNASRRLCTRLLAMAERLDDTGLKMHALKKQTCLRSSQSQRRPGP
jgi:hypothetical protein